MKTKKILALSLFLLSTAALADDAATPPDIDQAAVLAHLDQSADWYKAQLGLDALAQDPREISLNNSLKHNGEMALRQAIAFAHAEAALLDSAPRPQQTADAKSSLQQAADANVQRTAELNAALKDTASKLRTAASSRTRATLTALRDRQLSELKLVQAQADLLKTVMDLNGSTLNTSDLSSRIGDYEKMLPDADAKSARSAKTPDTATATADATDDTGSNSIFGLVGDSFDLARKKTRIRDLGLQSNAMRDAVQALLGNLRAQLHDAATQGRSMAPASDPAQLDAQRQQLDTLLTRFRSLATVVPSLAEQNMWVEASQRNLADWDKLAQTEMRARLRALAIRTLVLLLAILVPIFLARLAHRATLKYVQDERRQRQLRFIRRALLTVAIVFIVTVNFFSEFGSLATYAGLLTAGLAVALQNVILSLVAHFFFVGRFGVRIGDRVTIGDVTGDIVEIGFVRFYLMEIDGKSREQHPTGRIVAFPNSILFQQSAFFKQIPGTHYAWHLVTVLLSSTSDYPAAQEKLMKVLSTVLADYKDGMRQQQSILERSTRLKIALPEPESRLKFTDAGMAFEGRYPVELARATEIDDRVTRGLLTAIHDTAELRLAGSPQIESEQ